MNSRLPHSFLWALAAAVLTAPASALAEDSGPPPSLVGTTTTADRSAERARTSTAALAPPKEAPAPSAPTAVSGGEGVVTKDKRALPDYDGRGSPPATIGDVALFVPRVALFPAYLASEFILRRPFEWLIVHAERGQWQALIFDFFTFGEERNIGVFPSALVDFGFRPSAGIYSFWNKFIYDGNGLRLYAAFGGNDWYSVRFADKLKLPDDGGTVAVAVGGTRRPDFRFEGIGPDVDASLEFLARYRADRLEGEVSYETAIGHAGRIFAFAGARRVTFRDGTCCGNLALDDAIADGSVAAVLPDGLTAPPGFKTPYAVYNHGVEVDFDTRPARPKPSTGMRLELKAGQAFDLEGTLKSPWVTYGGALGGFLDVTGQNRVLSLFVSTELIDPTRSDGLIPFTELLTLGGAGSLTGFRHGALLGRSTAAARLEYRWPIWVWLDGSAHVAVGNVFDEHLDDFRWDRLRMSFGLGMRTVGKSDHSFSVLVAAGTETFERGADITAFRFVLGTTRGF